MRLAILALILMIGVTVMAINLAKTSPTKIPYNNGFYAGVYNPKLPVIRP